jgi:putative membrane protein
MEAAQLHYAHRQTLSNRSYSRLYDLSTYDERKRHHDAMSYSLSLGILGLVLAAPSLRADVKDKVKAMQSPADSKQFAMKAAEAGLFEVKLAQLAQQKSQDPKIKELARALERDHQMANDQLAQLAKQKNVDLPNEITGECTETYQAFQQLDGRDFENAYLLCNVTGHLKGIAMFQKEAQSGTDPDVKMWAGQTLPKLQQHARHIATVAQAEGLPVDALAVISTQDTVRPAASRIEPTPPPKSNSLNPETGSSSKGTGR